ncbi:YncE family protein [Paraburkholderia sp. RL17-337-BIB-A]
MQKVADVPLGGGTTRFDYESIDSSRHLLFIAHLGDSEVVAFNTEMSRVVGRVLNVSSVHGVLAIPELGRVYASATGTNEVVAIDVATLRITARMPAGAYPDGMAYVPEAHKLYVSDETGGTVTVIDVRSNTRIASIHLGGEAGNTQYDPVSKHIFVNVQTRNQLVEIDPVRDQIVARIDVPGARGNHGLLIAADQRLAFIACEGNDRLIVLDMRTMRVVSSFEVGKDPDVIAYDPSLHLLYVAGEAGVVSMFRVRAGVVSKLGDGHVGPNAHVVAVDVETHRSYFPLKNSGGQTMLRILQPRH